MRNEEQYNIVLKNNDQTSLTFVNYLCDIVLNKGFDKNKIDEIHRTGSVVVASFSDKKEAIEKIEKMFSLIEKNEEVLKVELEKVKKTLILSNDDVAVNNTENKKPKRKTL